MKRTLTWLILFLLPLFALAEAPTLWPACDGETGLWGYIDEEGAWQIEPQFYYAADFNGGCAIVDMSPDEFAWPGQQGFIDESGAFLLEPVYYVFDSGTGGAEFPEIYFVMDVTADDENSMGWFNIPNRYFSGLHWFECVAWAETPYVMVFKDRLAGLADRATGEIVLPLEYVDTSVYDYGTESGFVIATRADTGVDELIELGVGPVALPEGVTVDYGDRIGDGLLPYSQADGLMGYLNTKGEIVIPARYTSAGAFVDGYAQVCHDIEESFIIDRTGREIMRIQGHPWHTQYCGMVGDSLFIRWEDGSWGLATQEGEVIFRSELTRGYDTWLYEVAPDSPLWVQHSLGDEEYAWGLVSRTGEILQEPTWHLFGDALSDDPMGWQAVSRTEGEWRYVDAGGETVLPGLYRRAGHFKGALARVQFSESEEGYINRSGEVVCRWNLGDAANVPAGD